ncbi:MAG: response regulator [Pseudomonadota bacterium]
MSLTILTVDDSRMMREMLKLALCDNGFDVVQAEDGEDGLRQLSLSNVDVIITDINMPRLNGFEFIERVRIDMGRRGVPILILSTETGPEMKARAKAAGATGWITKPFNKEKLIAAIRRVAAMPSVER